jgi:hypothetical protein
MRYALRADDGQLILDTLDRQHDDLRRPVDDYVKIAREEGRTWAPGKDLPALRGGPASGSSRRCVNLCLPGWCVGQHWRGGHRTLLKSQSRLEDFVRWPPDVGAAPQEIIVRRCPGYVQGFPSPDDFT